MLPDPETTASCTGDPELPDPAPKIPAAADGSLGEAALGGFDPDDGNGGYGPWGD